jgi:hypothetical protein
MAGGSIAVFGIYPSSLDAERGAADLISAGYSSHDISVLLADVRSGAGASAGGLLGGALGILTGAGALQIPGVGPIVAAGPLLAGLAGLGVGGAAGGLMGALVGLGIPEYEARRYEGRVKDGGTLLSVRCESPAQVKRAKQVLNSSGADDVAACNETRSDETRSENVGLALI